MGLGCYCTAILLKVWYFAILMVYMNILWDIEVPRLQYNTLPLNTGVNLYFGPRVYLMGSMVIALVRPLVRPSVSPSLNISETAHCFFLIFCMKLGHHKGTKVTEPDFWRKKCWEFTWIFHIDRSLELSPRYLKTD